MIIEITHKEDKTIYKYEVTDANNLKNNEVKRICIDMNVKAIFVNGKYYEYKH